MNPLARERRSRDTRPQPAWRHPATSPQVYHIARDFSAFSSSFPPARGRIPHRRAALAAALATGNIGIGNTSTLATLPASRHE